MASVLNAPHFQDETAAYAKLESLVWPNGPVCPHCGGTERMKLMGGKATRPGLHKCYDCRKQSRVTVGTVFESSHVPLHMWLQAAYLMCSSKKGISSNQLHRTLGVTLKTAWFMSHRLRLAMTERGGIDVMGGAGGVVEIDETFIGNKSDVKVVRGYRHKHAVLSLVERRPEGARVRSFHVSGTARADLLPIIEAHVHPATHVMTDEAVQYAALRKSFEGHDFTRHGSGEYVRDGLIHTNTV
jgi:transposase-like protein